LLQSLREAFSQADGMHRERESRQVVQERFQALTPREQEIMRHIVTGVPNRALATRLGVSIRTIEVHRSRVMRKMQAGSLPDLVRLADLLDETS
jgi:two-component system response regulator FixJ